MEAESNKPRRPGYRNAVAVIPDRPTFTREESSNVAELKVNRKLNLFYVKYHTGRYYAYKDAAHLADELAALAAADATTSIGKFVAANLTSTAGRAKYEAFEFTHEMAPKKLS
jgi:hypothetical protein